MFFKFFLNMKAKTILDPVRLESIILKIIGKKIYYPPCHLQNQLFFGNNRL